MASLPCENCTENCLESIPFLSGLSPKEKALVQSHAVFKEVEKGAFLFEEGEAITSLFVLREGAVKLSSSDSEGREQIIGLFLGGDVIWESLFLGDAAYPYSAVALRKTRYCQILKKDFEHAIENQETALRVITLLSKKLHDANERNLILSTADPSQRLAKFFLYRQERSLEPQLLLRLDDIAASVSLRPETVSRKLQDFIAKGYLKKIGQSGFRILDFNGLKELAED
jgi:CRP/FNR family transcriptional regulator, anaerobic regulatory protein